MSRSRQVATSEPARLIGGVGPGGGAPHDVALVQALLMGAKKPNGVSFYRGPIDGRLGPRTLSAMGAFRDSLGLPSTSNTVPSFGTGDPVFNRLAQGQRLAAIEGTTTAYVPDFTGGGATFRDESQPKKLDPTTTQKLKDIIAEVQRTYGVVLDVVVPRKLYRPDMLVAGPKATELVAIAEFEPRDLVILASDGRQQRVYDVINLRFWSQEVATVLMSTLKGLIESRIAHFVPVDAGQHQLAEQNLRFQAEREADGIRRFWWALVELWQLLGFSRAAHFLRVYLDGQGQNNPDSPDIVLSREDALSFEPIREAYLENMRRFEEDSLRTPERKNKSGAFKIMKRITEDPTVKEVRLSDGWDYSFRVAHFSKKSINMRMSIALAGGEFDFFLSAGENNFRSDGDFVIRRDGRTLHVTGDITHTWADTFDFGGSFWYDRHAQLLEAHSLAKPFSWRAQWRDEGHKLNMIIFRSTVAGRRVVFERVPQQRLQPRL